MFRIVTLTLSPTIDKSTTVEKLVPEQKLACAAPTYEPGGGGINVSRALKRLGADSQALFPAGGPPGALLQQLLADEGIQQHSIAAEHWTRENFIVVETSTNQQYRFGMPGTRLLPAEQHNLLEAARQLQPEMVVFSGSLPPGVEPQYMREVAQMATVAGARLVVDTSGEALRQALEERVYLIKPNLGELSKLVGAASLDNESVVEAARTLIGRGKCEVIVVSMGPQGACLVTQDLVDFVPAPAVRKLSTVGAGDSMVAGIVQALASGRPLREAVRLGVACGTAATMNPGTELFRPADAERLFRWLLQTML